MNEEHWLGALGLVALLAPVAATLLLGGALVVGVKASEAGIARVIALTFGVSFLASLGVDALVLSHPAQASTVTLAHWMVLPSYAIEARLVFDLPAAVLMTLTSMLCGLIGAFSAPYLHKDPGYRRFMVLLPLFAAGMMAVAAADTLDLIYAGWEIVGISSALLIAYFHTREGPVRHGLRAFATYRLCDVALLAAAVLMHHHAPDASFGAGAHLEPHDGMLIGGLLVFAAMGKAAAFPFTGWLPRAMEGPTPSSAIFYGALSIHAGPFLLIRAWPILESQPVVRGVLLAIGLVTAAHATMVGRAQTDVKAALGYASVTQVAVIMVEVALGFTGLALVHLTSHAVLRTWQLLRAPSVLADRRELIGRLGGDVPPRGTHWEQLLPSGLRRFGYRLALDRWLVDDLGARFVLAPARWALGRIDAWDRRTEVWLSGAPDEEVSR
jgi:NADH-quinone oxidoreductase subunit L